MSGKAPGGEKLVSSGSRTISNSLAISYSSPHAPFSVWNRATISVMSSSSLAVHSFMMRNADSCSSMLSSSSARSFFQLVKSFRRERSLRSSPHSRHDLPILLLDPAYEILCPRLAEHRVDVFLVRHLNTDDIRQLVTHLLVQLLPRIIPVFKQVDPGEVLEHVRPVVFPVLYTGDPDGRDPDLLEREGVDLSLGHSDPFIRPGYNLYVIQVTRQTLLSDVLPVPVALVV